MTDSPFPLATATSTELVVAAPVTASSLDRPKRQTLLPTLWEHVVRWKWVIVGIVAMSLVVGLFATSAAPRLYTATARLDLAREPERSGDAKDTQAQTAALNAEYYQTQHALLHSRSLATRVAVTLDLARNPGFAGSRTRVAGIGRSQSAPPAIVDKLLDATRIVPIAGSSLVDIRVETRDPELSARIANEWTARYIQSTLDKRFQSTASARRFLEGRLSELRERIGDSERELVAYSTGSGVIPLVQSDGIDGDTRTQQTLAGQNLVALDTALTNATADRIAAQSRVSSSGPLSLQASASLIGLRQQRAEIAANYAKLVTQFEPGYPAAQALQSQLNTLDQTINREEARIRDGLNNEYRQAVRREAELRAQVNALKGKIVAEQRGSVRSGVLRRDVDTNRQLYAALLQRYKEVGAQGIGVNNIAIVDSAEAPRLPSSPNLPANLLIALATGIALAAIAVAVLVQMDEPITSAEGVHRHLAHPLLGVIPSTGERDPRGELTNHLSPTSEAHIALLAGLSFTTNAGMPRTMAITSTRVGEGKSMTCYALATLLARAGRRVLLIDAHMRAPTLHRLFQQDNVEGFSNLLAGDDDWQSMVKPCGNARLSLLTSGPNPPSPAQLLKGPRLRAMVATFADHFDHVLIDCPSASAGLDAMLIAPTVQGVLYLVEAGGPRLRKIHLALARMESVGATMLGTVLTKLIARRDAPYPDQGTSGYHSADKRAAGLLGRG